MTRSAKTLLPLAAMILASVAIWTWPAGPASVARDALAPAQTEAAKDDLAALAQVTAQRPLFDSSRRALATPEAPAPQPVADARLSLAGILTDANQPIALLRMSTDGRLHQAIQGDEISNWRIVQIDSASVTIQGQSGSQSVLRLGQ